MPLGLIVALVVLALVVVAVPLARGRGAAGYERIVRCRAGHLFTSTVVPGASIKAVRLWNTRFQRCPVGHHWTLFRAVDEKSLSPAERDSARAVHDALCP